LFLYSIASGHTLNITGQYLDFFVWNLNHLLNGNKQYFKGLSTTSTENPKRFWAYYQTKYKNKTTPTSLQYNWVKVSDAQEKAELFNNYCFQERWLCSPSWGLFFSVTFIIITSLLVTIYPLTIYGPGISGSRAGQQDLGVFMCFMYVTRWNNTTSVERMFKVFVYSPLHPVQ